MTITVRRGTPDDAEAVADMFGEKSVLAGMMQLPFPQVATWRERLANADGSVSLIACGGDQVVGLLGLHPNLKTPRRAHTASIGMGVARSWQRKGVGSALLAAAIDLADNWFGLTRLELSVYVDNEAGVGLYKKFGFEIEGTLRKYALRDGVLVDTYTMARLHDRPR